MNVSSKNGMTLLGVAPRADGTLPKGQIEILNGLGEWMKVNKSVLYGSDWRVPCEMGSLHFVINGDYLYAIDKEKPTVPEVIPGVIAKPGSDISMVGSKKKLSWHQDGENLVIEELPDPLPCDHAWIFRITENKSEK